VTKLPFQSVVATLLLSGACVDDADADSDTSSGGSSSGAAEETGSSTQGNEGTTVTPETGSSSGLPATTSSGEDSGTQGDPVDGLVRVASPVLDVRVQPSPSTGRPTMLGAFDPCTVWDPQAQRWRAYFTFADDVAEQSNLPRAGIAAAVSDSPDGTSFSVLPELALTQLGTFDSESVETCDVVRVEDDESPTGQRFLMFYSGGRGQTDSNYVIALATSEDGVSFEPLESELARDGEAGVLFGVSEAMGAPEVDGNFITDPVVAVREGLFHLWTLCIQQVPKREIGGGICHATSPDAITWTHLGPVEGLDRAFAIQPTVFFNPELDLFEMYVVMDTPREEALIHNFNVNLALRVSGFYHATSADGMSWEYDPVQAFSEDTSLPWEDLGLATAADAEYLDGEVFFFYPSLTTQGGSILGEIANWPLNLALRWP
jgi:hypothetical protein